MGMLLYAPVYTALDDNGKPVSGAQMYGYLSGTTTAVTLYQDGDLATPFATPPESDDAGRFPNVYYNASIATRIKVLMPDASLLDDIDPVNDPSVVGNQTTYGSILMRCLGGVAPASSEVMDMFVADHALEFFPNFDGTSQGFAAPKGKTLGAPGGGNYVVTVKKNNVQVGTITVANGATANWAFATSGGTSFSMDPGDWLTCEAPVTVDAAFINSAWTFPVKVLA